MSTPIARPADLGLYLNDTNIDFSRATFILAKAQTLCETVVNPLPDGADAVVLPVAARAFNNVTSAHQMGIGSAQISYGAQGNNMGVGGLYLSRSDKATLRRLAGYSAAFSIDMWPPE